MTEPRTAPATPRELREQAATGPVPRFLLDDWRERYGIVAGITGRGDAGDRGFDLGLWTDAAVGDVMGRWRQFRSAEPGFPAVVLGTQVHGREVAWHPIMLGAAFKETGAKPLTQTPLKGPYLLHDAPRFEVQQALMQYEDLLPHALRGRNDRIDEPFA